MDTNKQIQPEIGMREIPHRESPSGRKSNILTLLERPSPRIRRNRKGGSSNMRAKSPREMKAEVVERMWREGVPLRMIANKARCRMDFVYEVTG